MRRLIGLALVAAMMACGFTARAQENPDAFYPVWAKLLPKELKANANPDEIRVFVHRDGDSRHVHDTVETA